MLLWLSRRCLGWTVNVRQLKRSRSFTALTWRYSTHIKMRMKLTLTEQFDVIQWRLHVECAGFSQSVEVILFKIKLSSEEFMSWCLEIWFMFDERQKLKMFYIHYALFSPPTADTDIYVNIYLQRLRLSLQSDLQHFICSHYHFTKSCLYF